MKKVGREVVWEGERFDVVVERWGDTVRELAEHGGSVAIVAVDREGRLVLTRQFREAVRETLLELPAGILETGEIPLEAARRELAEETGLHGGSWRRLRTIHPSPGFLREPVTIFLAEDLDEGEPHPGESEQIDVVRLTRAELEAELERLEDAKTLVGVLLYLREGR
jgi:ADP-ribose pyrophosphatase